MKIINTQKELKEYISECRSKHQTIGLVPTMGALHEGHLSLVSRCKKENDVCVVSDFVNPTQFNDPTDLATYPRCFDDDVALLEKAGCDVVFAPSVEEMYPEPDTRIFDLGYVAEVMEGKKRPGHFNGVAQIVSKLFYAVEPDKAYFGEKDFQQIAVIKAMVKQLKLSLEIVPCPIVRESDGLALSSRNRRLTDSQRAIAPNIHKIMKASVEASKVKSVAEIHDEVVKNINALPELEVEYFELVDGDTLKPITTWEESKNPVGCITVYCGPVRLIDNIHYR